MLHKFRFSFTLQRTDSITSRELLFMSRSWYRRMCIQEYLLRRESNSWSAIFNYWLGLCILTEPNSQFNRNNTMGGLSCYTKFS